jgi:hypothetical protein
VGSTNAGERFRSPAFLRPSLAALARRIPARLLPTHLRALPLEELINTQVTPVTCDFDLQRRLAMERHRRLVWGISTISESGIQAMNRKTLTPAR